MRNKQEILSKESVPEVVKLKQLEELRAYNRKYYHEHKVPVECQWCKKSFSNQSSITRHLAANQKCKIRCLEAQVEKLKEQLEAPTGGEDATALTV